MLRPIFVASIGNPPPTYSNTLHSAGHTVLQALHDLGSYPAFARSRSHANGLVAQGPEFTLWQSPSLMNVSGKPVVTAWHSFLRDLDSDGERRAARLVVLHDELESPLGRVKIKIGSSGRGGGSVKGHNGLKSVVQALGGGGGGGGGSGGGGQGGKEGEGKFFFFARVGVGIGRCESRESADVARFVLRRMRPAERDAITRSAADVLAALNEMRK